MLNSYQQFYQNTYQHSASFIHYSVLSSFGNLQPKHLQILQDRHLHILKHFPLHLCYPLEQYFTIHTSVLGCHWLGDRKSIRPTKKLTIHTLGTKHWVSIMLTQATFHYHIAYLLHAKTLLMHVSKVKHCLCTVLLLGRHSIMHCGCLIVHLSAIAVIMVVTYLHSCNSVAWTHGMLALLSNLTGTQNRRKSSRNKLYCEPKLS